MKSLKSNIKNRLPIRYLHLKQKIQIQKSYFVIQHYNETFLKLIIYVNFSIDFKLRSKRNCKDISDKFWLTVRTYTYLWKYLDWNHFFRLPPFRSLKKMSVKIHWLSSFFVNKTKIFYVDRVKTKLNRTNMIICIYNKREHALFGMKNRNLLLYNLM